MTTTAIIVEIIVIGYTSFIWIVIFLLSCFDVELNIRILNNMNEYKDWIPIFTIFSIALAYQIGWLIDYFSHILFYYIIGGRKIKRKFIPNNEFFNRHNLICQMGSQETHNILKTDLGIIRFSRSGIANFLLIGISLSLFFNNWFVLPIFIFIAAGCFLILRNREYHYYERVEMFYQLIKDTEL